MPLQNPGYGLTDLWCLQSIAAVFNRGCLRGSRRNVVCCVHLFASIFFLRGSGLMADGAVGAFEIPFSLL